MARFSPPYPGNLPIDLSLTVAVSTMALLYMPRSEEVDSPILQVRVYSLAVS